MTTLTDMLQSFESFGDNCEFGFIQRDGSVEDGGLFRWARIVDISQLIAILDDDFHNAYRFENLQVEDGDMVLDKLHGIRYHTEMSSEKKDGRWVCTLPEETKHEIYKREVQKRYHLIAKTREMLTSGSKVIVYKSNHELDEWKIYTLLKSIRRYGNCTLLWVKTASNENPAGTVARRADGLLVGYITRFAPYWPATDYLREDWNLLVQNAYAIWHGLRLQSETGVAAENA